MNVAQGWRCAGEDSMLYWQPGLSQDMFCERYIQLQYPNILKKSLLL